MTGTRTVIVAIAFAALGAAPAAHAQLSANVGFAVPASNEADAFNNGVHLGAALKLPVLPLQLEAALDRMGGEGNVSDVTVFSIGAAVPLSVTPQLLPGGVYVLAGGGLYNLDAGVSSTDVGITGGAGVRLRLPGLSPFAEGRGVLIFSEGDKFTYLTAAIGLRF